MQELRLTKTQIEALAKLAADGREEFSLADLAAALGCSVTTAYRHVESGPIRARCYMRGSRRVWRIPATSIRALLPVVAA